VLPNATFDLDPVPDAGHWIQQERPEDVTILLTDFFYFRTESRP
jgi:pimeloyl-ACP methyl ester carboxylesterase